MVARRSKEARRVIGRVDFNLVEGEGLQSNEQSVFGLAQEAFEV